jgi:YD repeat-containing protein
MLNCNTITYPFTKDDLQALRTFTVGNKVEYEGYARPGALSSVAEWQISKYTYDGSGNCTGKQFAGGVHDYDKIWDNRASYSYS